MTDQLETPLCTIAVPPEYRRFVEAAALRFSYLYPSAKVVVDDSVSISADSNASAADIARDFKYALYRQKIYEESQPIRTLLIQSVMGS